MGRGFAGFWMVDNPMTISWVENPDIPSYYSAHHGNQDKSKTILHHDVSSYVSFRRRCCAAAHSNH